MLSDRLQAWRSSGDVMSYQGHQVFYKTEGQGEPLLLIHGFPSASIDWAEVWPELVSRFQVITLDLLGFGFSDKPRQLTYSVSLQADLIVHVVKTLKIRRLHILAHDYGDTVTQELLARYLEGGLTVDIQSVTLLNGGLFPETHKPLLIQKLLMSPVGGLLAKFMTQQKFSASLRKICSEHFSNEVIEDLWQLLEWQGGRNLVPKLIYYMQERRDYRERWVGALQQADAVAIPIHLIDGVIDSISGQNLVNRFRQLVPEAKVTELAGIGHYPQIEAPDQVVTAFMEGLIALQKQTTDNLQRDPSRV